MIWAKDKPEGYVKIGSNKPFVLERVWIIVFLFSGKKTMKIVKEERTDETIA